MMYSRLINNDTSKAEFKTKNHYASICEEIIHLDDSIKFVGFTSPTGTLLDYKCRSETKSLLSTRETELYAWLAFQRNQTRKTFDKKLGEVLYSVTAYKKIKRADLILDDGTLLMISFDILSNECLILQKIMKLLNNKIPHNVSQFFNSLLPNMEKRINKEKMTFIGTLGARLAHDLRNPLTVIEISLENIKMLYGGDKIQIKHFERIDRSMDRITHQIDDVLDFVKERPLELRKVMIFEIIAGTLDLLNIPDRIKLIHPNNDVELVCDEKQLSIAMKNIFLNSIQAIDDAGTIEITVEEDDDKVVIKVKDSGKAIPDDEVGRIFEPLFTTKEQGTGLGLVSVKAIIDAHNGTIDVTSSPVIFTITLPKVLDYTSQK